KPWRNARRMSALASGNVGLRTPTTGIAASCARAASGHVAAAPPSRVMNARRFIRSPRQWTSLSWVLGTLYQRASACREWSIVLVSWYGGQHFVDVPLVLGLGRRLDLNQVHIVDHATVVTNTSILGEEVVDGHCFHLRHHNFRLIGPSCINGLEVVHHCGIHPGLDHGRHVAFLLEEPLGESAACIIHIPIETFSNDHPLRGI